jgi:hypothetical protein
MEIPEVFEGGKYSDDRGSSFSIIILMLLKSKIYCIENTDLQFIRGWTGHKVEERWFSALQGSFTIKLVKIDDWVTPLKNQKF